MRHLVKMFAMIASLTAFSFLSYGESLSVEGAWVRMPPPVSDTAAVYLTLSNSGSEDVKVTGLISDASETAEFHSMMMHGNMMHMAEMKDVIVPAEGNLVFATGGNHLMLIGLTRKLNAGDVVKLKITTSSGATYNVEADVRDMRKHNEHDHMNKHDHHQMH